MSPVLPLSIVAVAAVGVVVIEAKHYLSLISIALAAYAIVFALIISLSWVAPELVAIRTPLGLLVCVSIEEMARAVVFVHMSRSADFSSPSPFYIRAGYGAAYGIVEYLSKWLMLGIGWIEPDACVPGTVDVCSEWANQNAIYLLPIFLHIGLSAGIYSFGLSRRNLVIACAAAIGIHWEYNSLILNAADLMTPEVGAILIFLLALYFPARIFRKRDPWGALS